MRDAVQQYISSFRVRELQTVLEQLGLPKSGRKSELIARIFGFFGEAPPTGIGHDLRAREQWRLEAAERVITTTYCDMMGVPHPAVRSTAAAAQPASAAAVQSSHTGMAQASPNGYVNSSLRPSPIVKGAALRGGASSPFYLKLKSDKFANQRSTTIRCLCGDNCDRGTMIQCEGEKCGVWQHTVCVGVDGAAPPEHFFCELCRAALADPFWKPQRLDFFPPAALRPVPGRPPAYLVPGEKPQQAQDATRSFNIQPGDATKFRTRTDHQLQVVCVQLGDAVPFRFHWPRAADLRINNMAYRPYGRNPSTKLGNNARDEPANVGQMCFSGRNRISLSSSDDLRYAVTIQLVRQRSQAEVRLKHTSQVRQLMAPPPDLQTAVASVRRAITGSEKGCSAGDTSDGDDDDLSATSMIVSLRCPLSGSRIVTPGRFHGVPGLACFDLDTFLTMTERSRKWQCPHSMRHMSVRELHVDPYVSRLLLFLKDQPDVVEVEVDTHGQWRCDASGGPWTDITADPATYAASGPAIKPDPDTQVQMLSSDESDEESEGAELRAAAAAYAASSSKRKREPERQSPEVIVLSSDSEDGAASRPAVRHQGFWQPLTTDLLQAAHPSMPQERIQRIPQQNGLAGLVAAAASQTPQHRSRQPTVLQAFGRAQQQQRPNGTVQHAQTPLHSALATAGAKSSCPGTSTQPAPPPAGRPAPSMSPASGPHSLMPPIPAPGHQPGYAAGALQYGSTGPVDAALSQAHASTAQQQRGHAPQMCQAAVQQPQPSQQAGHQQPHASAAPAQLPTSHVHGWVPQQQQQQQQPAALPPAASHPYATAQHQSMLPAPAMVGSWTAPQPQPPATHSAQCDRGPVTAASPSGLRVHLRTPSAAQQPGVQQQQTAQQPVTALPVSPPAAAQQRPPEASTPQWDASAVAGSRQAPSARQSAPWDGFSQASALSTEELAKEAELASLPDDCFEEFFSGFEADVQPVPSSLQEQKAASQQTAAPPLPSHSPPPLP